MDNGILLKIGKARAVGYSPAEIVDYIGQDPSISAQIKTARENKYGDEEILGYIAKSKIDPNAMPTDDRSGIMMEGPGISQDLKLGGAAELLGGLAGGMAPTIRQRIPAAAILGAGGQGLYQLYQHATGNPNAPQTSEEAATRMGIGGATQGAGQIGGELLTRGISKVLPHVQERFMIPDKTGSEDALRQYMEPYMNKGLSERMMDKIYSMLPDSLKYEQFAKPGFTVAQKADPLSGAHRMEQVVESSFFGSKPIKEFKFAQQRGLEDWSKKLAGDVWGGVEKMPPSERGRVFTEAFDKAEEGFRQVSKARYGEVDKILGGETVETISRKTSSISDASGKPFTFDVSETSNRIVDLAPFKKWVKQELAQDAKFVGIGSGKTGEGLLSKAENLADNMSFADTHELRSRVIKEMKAAQGRGEPVAFSDIAKVTSQIDTAMEQAAKNAGGDAEKVWREANSFYKEGKETFDNGFIESLVKKAKDMKQPELIGKSLFQNGEISQIKMAKEVLKNDTQTFQSMKAGWLEDVFTDVSKSDGTVVGNTFFRKLKGMGDETLREIFTKSELAMIRKFEEAATKTQKLGSAGGGSILIQLMQAGALGGALTGAWFKDPDIVAGGLAILVAPRVLGRMIVNPRYHNLFYNGLSTEKPVALPAITKLAAEAIKVNKQIEQSNQNQETQQMRISQ
jgi:hypothetical protein